MRSFPLGHCAPTLTLPTGWGGNYRRCAPIPISLPRPAGEGRGGGEVSHIWKLSVPPATGPAVAAAIRDRLDADLYFDWAGGLIWVSAPPASDAAAVIRGALNGAGHATLVRAPDDVRASADVFHPLAEPLMALSRRVKDSFDPRGILSPGRMYAGV